MFGQNTEVRIIDFILVQTGTYQEQELRPFETTVTMDSINALHSSSRGGSNISSSALQDVAGDILHPQATTEGRVNIANGWQSRRFQFMMRVEEKQPFQTNGRTQRVLFGYSDHCEVSLQSQHLDPNMRIYFNSETVVVDHVRQGPQGPYVVAEVVGSNQIVSPLDMSGASGFTNGMTQMPTSYLIRPGDVFYHSQSNHVVDNLLRSGEYGNDIAATFDSRTIAGHGGGAYQYSRRNDTSPSRYLTHTFDAYNKALMEAESEQFSDNLDLLYGAAAGFADAQAIHTNTLFNQLRERAAYMEKGFVTLAEMMQIFPETDSVMKVAMDNGTSIRKVSWHGDSEHWHGSSKMDIAASTLAQVVPAIMMDNFIRSISFAATNGQGYGEYAIEIHPERTYGVVDNLPLAPYLEKFYHRLIVDALNSITYRNQVGFQISMSSDLAGESVIDISLDGESVTRYVAPTFSDSLFAPVITQEFERPNKISGDITYLLTETVPSAASTAAQQILGANGQPFQQPAQPPQAQPYGQQLYIQSNHAQPQGAQYDAAYDSGLL